MPRYENKRRMGSRVLNMIPEPSEVDRRKAEEVSYKAFLRKRYALQITGRLVFFITLLPLIVAVVLLAVFVCLYLGPHWIITGNKKPLSWVDDFVKWWNSLIDDTFYL